MITFMRAGKKRNSWLLASIAVLVGMILFPYGWLANHWELFDHVVEVLFATERMHVVGHVLLYGGLGTAVLTIFPKLQLRPQLYIAGILVIAIFQEALQLITFKHHFFSANEIFDLGVDLMAAGTIFVAWVVARNIRKPHETPHTQNYNL
jgi:hypothetical protein